MGLLVLWSAWLGWLLLAPDRNADGRCAGLGFGCTMTPRDVAELAGIILVAPVSVLVVVVTGVVRLVRIRRGSPRTVWDLVLGVLLAVISLAWVAGSVAGAF